MKHGSLFSGIGGFDLAAEWMGWENIFHCEINPFCQRILKYYWPNAKSYGDITKTDFTIYRGLIDVLSGGFPCQPFSNAGEQKGTEDDRHLWPEMLRAIREIQPVDIVGENVLGITSWNKGLVFEQVCIDLEAEGYQVQPVILPACAVNADHRRDRVWFVAHSDSLGRQRGQDRTPHQAPHEQLARLQPADTWAYLSTPDAYNGKNGLPIGLDGPAFSKWRDQTNRAGGNAIVPQVAYEIFQVIEAMNNQAQLFRA